MFNNNVVFKSNIFNNNMLNIVIYVQKNWNWTKAIVLL